MVAEPWCLRMGNQVSTNVKRQHSLLKQGQQEKQIIGILSFEVANMMSKIIHLHKSLIDSEIIKVKNEIFKSVGVKVLVSDDEDKLLELVLVEKLDDLNRVASVVSRLGKKCTIPALQGFEHVYGDVVCGVIDVKDLGFLVKDMEGMVRKMERYVNTTASLYCEMAVLNELEVATKKFQQNQHEESRKAFEQKLAWQKQDVRHLEDVSLWNQTYDKVVELLAWTVCTVYARITVAFGNAKREGFSEKSGVIVADSKVEVMDGEFKKPVLSYCQNGLFDDVLVLLEEMRSSNVEPDSRVFTTILSACGKTRNLAIRKVIHGLISDNNIIADSRLLSSLISMYAGCGCMDLAQNLYDKLSQKNLVVSTAMISGYSKVWQVEAARSIFDQMTDKDLVCWSAMISGYVESDQPQEALKLLDKMQASGVKPDQVTMLSIISACANLGALDQAKRIHLIVDKYRFREALPVNNALIDMYAKCGYLDGARGVFGRMRRKNVISWTSMISASAIHGEADQALMLFRQMKEPNWITFVAVLYACSHAGLVDEAQQIFSSMVNEYNITPKLEHYDCMVDLYGRANRLREALELVETMPMAPNVVIWGSLMAACRIHGEFELGEFAAKRLLELDPEHDGAYVFLSNVYAKGKRWENVGEVRQLMKHKGIWKERGHSKIEMDNEIHEFLTADKSHKHADDIYGKLAEVVCKLKQVGYAPNSSVVLIDVDEDEKKDMVLLHSEKLALCYGLLRSNNGSPIHIIKNLRICEDCHNFMKLASKVFEREIVVRDRTRFHHYRDGSCSCKDYW